MSGTLVVVYSHTGTSARAAQLLCAQQQWPLGRIVDRKPGRGSGRCVVDSLLRRRPAILYNGPDPASFDAVVLVSPIWLGRLAGPMRSFVAARRHLLRRLAVVSVMGGKGGAKAAAEVAALTDRDPLFDMAVTAQEVNTGLAGTRLDTLARAVRAAIDPNAAPVRPVELSTEAS